MILLWKGLYDAMLRQPEPLLQVAIESVENDFVLSDP